MIQVRGGHPDKSDCDTGPIRRERMGLTYCPGLRETLDPLGTRSWTTIIAAE